MKKLLTMFALALMIVVGGGVMAACGGHKETELSVWWSNEISASTIYNEANSNKDEKYAQYDLEVVFGEFVDVNDIEVRWNDGKNSSTISKKSDSSDGYEIAENTLPTTQAEQIAGDYVIKIVYADWTNEIKIKINKKQIQAPYLDNFPQQEYVFTGDIISPNFIYDSDYVELVEGDMTGIALGNYSATFALKYPNSTEWADREDKTANEVINWQIVKGTIDVTPFFDINELTYPNILADYVEYDGQEKVLTYTIPSGLDAYVEFYYVNDRTGIKLSSNPSEIGSYSLYVAIKTEYQQYFDFWYHGNNEGSAVKVGSLDIYTPTAE